MRYTNKNRTLCLSTTPTGALLFPLDKDGRAVRARAKFIHAEDIRKVLMESFQVSLSENTSK